jgi:hypothetical protein
MVGMARAAQFLAWLRNRFDEFLSADEVPETDSYADVKPATTQVPRTPIWDAWSWPGHHAQKKVPADTSSNKPSGPIPPSVVMQGTLGAHAGMGKGKR